jgi:hypothetical protein
MCNKICTVVSATVRGGSSPGLRQPAVPITNEQIA